MSRVDLYGGARGKRTKEEAMYYPVSDDTTRCGGCGHFLPPHSCERVKGEIARAGWCKLWVKRG